MKRKFFPDRVKKIKRTLNYIIGEIEDARLLKMMKAVDRNDNVSREEVMKKLAS